MQSRNLYLGLVIVAATAVPAQAELRIPQNAHQNIDPTVRFNTYCAGFLNRTWDGDFSSEAESYCPVPPLPAGYYVEYFFDLALDEKMTGVSVWANSGTSYTDGELRGFDLEVTYIDDNGTTQVLSMTGVNLGDTIDAADVKTVDFLQGGVPVSLRGVTKLRISNLTAEGTGDFVWREFQGNVTTETVSSSLTVSKTANPRLNVDAGTDVTYTYVVKNNGNQPISNITLNDVHDGLGSPKPVPGNETLSADKGHSGDSSDSTANDGVWDTLAPYDEITLTSTYTVTYRDIEARQ